MRLLLRWLIAALALMLAAYVLPGANVALGPALMAALVLGLLNAFLRPLIVLLTLPLNILTLGLFSIIINALMIILTSAIVPGFVIANFGTAILFALVLAIVNILFFSLVNEVQTPPRKM